MGIAVIPTETCPHVTAWADWIRNDGLGPPVLLLGGLNAQVIAVTMMNQKIYVRCPECFNRLRCSLKED